MQSITCSAEQAHSKCKLQTAEWFLPSSVSRLSFDFFTAFRRSFPFALNRLPERLDNGRDNTRDTASVIAGDDSFSTLFTLADCSLEVNG